MPVDPNEPGLPFRHRLTGYVGEGTLVRNVVLRSIVADDLNALDDRDGGARYFVSLQIKRNAPQRALSEKHDMTAGCITRTLAVIYENLSHADFQRLKGNASLSRPGME